MSADLCFLTIASAAKLITARKLSPVELAQAHLDRVESLNPKLRAFITVTPEIALRQARQAEQEILRRSYRGPLHGIPISFKDNIATKGIRTTGACAAYADRVPDADSNVSRRMVSAGAVVLGKANLMEMAWASTSEDHPFPPSRNPWHTGYPTGGSSTGSAAGVAAGLAMGSIGSDSGGSIRSPAALCGVTGLKPTYGRVGRGGVLPLSYSLDTIGPIARSVEDVAILLQAIAGFDPEDPASSREPVPGLLEAVHAKHSARLRIGILPGLMEAAGLDVEVMKSFTDAVGTLRSRRFVIREIEIPHIRYSPAAAWTLLRMEGFHAHFALLRDQRSKLGDDFVRKTAAGGFLTTGDYLRAQQARFLISEEIAKAFTAVDLILTPTTPEAASPAVYAREPADARLARSGRAFLAPFNLSGGPAISVPAGFNAAGLPIGIQLAARPFEEETLLSVAQQFQLAAGWHRPRPPA